MCDACLVLWLCSVMLYNSPVIAFIGHHLLIACFKIVLSPKEVTEMDWRTWFDCRWAIMNVCSHAALLSIILIFMPIMLNSYSIELSPLLCCHEWYVVLWISNYIRNIIYFRSSPKKLSLFACYNVIPNLFDWLTLFLGTQKKIFLRMYRSLLSIQSFQASKRMQKLWKSGPCYSFTLFTVFRIYMIMALCEEKTEN